MMYLAAIAMLASAKQSPIETIPGNFNKCKQSLLSKKLECNGFTCDELFGKDCRKVRSGIKYLSYSLIGGDSYSYKNCRFTRTLSKYRWNMACRSDSAELKKGCPLNPKITCKGVTAVEDTAKRIQQMTYLKAWFGVKYDFVARAGDQVAFDLECPKGSKAPFAVHASNGMYVRFMATRDSAWQVASLAVKDLRKIGCNRKLRPTTRDEVLKQRQLQKKNKCPGHKKGSMVESAKNFCVMVPSALVLWPEGDQTLNAFSLSVSSMNIWQRLKLNHRKTMAVVYKCKGQKKVRMAWKNLQWLTNNQILMLADKTTDASQTGLVKLTQRHWKDRCA